MPWKFRVMEVRSLARGVSPSHHPRFLALLPLVSDYPSVYASKTPLLEKAAARLLDDPAFGSLRE